MKTGDKTGRILFRLLTFWKRLGLTSLRSGHLTGRTWLWISIFIVCCLGPRLKTSQQCSTAEPPVDVTCCRVALATTQCHNRLPLFATERFLLVSSSEVEDGHFWHQLWNTICGCHWNTDGAILLKKATKNKINNCDNKYLKPCHLWYNFHKQSHNKCLFTEKTDFCLDLVFGIPKAYRYVTL